MKRIYLLAILLIVALGSVYVLTSKRAGNETLKPIQTELPNLEFAENQEGPSVTIINTKSGHDVVLSIENLRQFAQQEILTLNDFVDEETKFTGPYINDIIRMFAPEGTKHLRFIAADEYSVEIDINEFIKYWPILALEANGKEFSPRDWGPAWVIYPTDQFEELGEVEFNARLIWQVVKIEFK